MQSPSVPPEAQIPAADRQELSSKGFDIVGTEPIAKGVHGCVFRARLNSKANRGKGECVVKMCVVSQRQSEAELDNEAKMLEVLKHPNIVVGYHYQKLGDRRYFALEFLNGKTLAEKLSTLSPELTEYEALQAIRHMTAGVHYLHQNRVVHNDLHSSNIMSNEDSQRAIVYKIVDFGRAKPLDKAIVLNEMRMLAAGFVRILEKADFKRNDLKVSIRGLVTPVIYGEIKTMDELQQRMSQVISDQVVAQITPKPPTRLEKLKNLFKK